MHAWSRQRDSIMRRSVPGIEIRGLVEADLDDILALWRELMDFHVSIDRRFVLADNADHRFFGYLDTARARDDYHVRVAVDGDRPVGFAVSCILPNSPVYRAQWIGYINDLCVTRSMRKHGVGELLVGDAVDWLERNGAESIEVYVARANDAGQRFWRAVGAEDYLDRLSLNLSSFEKRRRR